MLRFYTAGESHGQALVAMMLGLPAGLELDLAWVDRELKRRMGGYGRGGRMKIERDRAQFLSGVRHGRTIGSPITVLIENQDWKNWTQAMAVEASPEARAQYRPLAQPRPGHADLAGCLKYNLPDARYVLERASARETAARVALGAVARLLLREFGIEIASHVIQVGRVRLASSAPFDAVRALREREEIVLNCVDAEIEARMKGEVDQATRDRDSVGGVFEVVAHGVPPGLGSMAQWDERLDGILAQAIASVQAVKAVEIGNGVDSAGRFGSEVHDEIGYDREQSRFTRKSNRAGGLEGGMSNGEEIVVRGYLKPISTLRRPLESVDFGSREPVKAAYERSDVCVVPAAGVAAEAMMGLVLARAFLEKFGGDSLEETRRNFRGYQEQVRRF
ncbi:MAG TPA: chorismate synthase [Terriglobia bacterium]|jgi:chorismate synthase|nr:chorismate synthase [Terriglobia bacterium]